MNIEIMKQDKKDVELRIDNVTVAEILRVYLQDLGVDFAAWRREHPSKPVFFKITSTKKDVKKVVSEAIAAIKKDADAVLAVVSK